MCSVECVVQSLAFGALILTLSRVEHVVCSVKCAVYNMICALFTVYCKKHGLLCFAVSIAQWVAHSGTTPLSKEDG